MEALFGRRGDRLRTNPDAVAFALDLTPEAIILHERAARGDWKKFASAQLDDPELPIVIGLLRNEAEAYAGGRRPVRLWLPGEQVLKHRTRIEDGPSAARLRAAFEYVDHETVYRPEDVAVAVAPTNRNGETTLLITFAETWREARDYAARWGFLPGEISTRHHAGDFGADGPVFQLNLPPPEPSAPMRRSRLAVVALAAIAAGGDTMRNILLGASAIAIISATPVSAAEWKVRVGGYGEYLVGYGTSSVDNVSGEEYDGVDVKQDVETHCRHSGLKVGSPPHSRHSPPGC